MLFRSPGLWRPPRQGPCRGSSPRPSALRVTGLALLWLSSVFASFLCPTKCGRRRGSNCPRTTKGVQNRTPPFVHRHLMSRQSGAGLTTTQIVLKWYVIFSSQVQSFFVFLLLHFFINCTCNVSTHTTTLVYVVHYNICVTELHFLTHPIICVKKGKRK